MSCWSHSGAFPCVTSTRKILSKYQFNVVKTVGDYRFYIDLLPNPQSSINIHPPKRVPVKETSLLSERVQANEIGSWERMRDRVWGVGESLGQGWSLRKWKNSWLRGSLRGRSSRDLFLQLNRAFPILFAAPTARNFSRKRGGEGVKHKSRCKSN